MLAILHTFSSSLAHPPPAHPAIDDNAHIRSEILASPELWGEDRFFRAATSKAQDDASKDHVRCNRGVRECSA